MDFLNTVTIIASNNYDEEKNKQLLLLLSRIKKSPSWKEIEYLLGIYSTDEGRLQAIDLIIDQSSIPPYLLSSPSLPSSSLLPRSKIEQSQSIIKTTSLSSELEMEQELSEALKTPISKKIISLDHKTSIRSKTLSRTKIEGILNSNIIKSILQRFDHGNNKLDAANMLLDWTSKSNILQDDMNVFDIVIIIDCLRHDVEKVTMIMMLMQYKCIVCFDCFNLPFIFNKLYFPSSMIHITHILLPVLEDYKPVDFLMDTDTNLNVPINTNVNVSMDNNVNGAVNTNVNVSMDTNVNVSMDNNVNGLINTNVNVPVNTNVNVSMDNVNGLNSVEDKKDNTKDKRDTDLLNVDVNDINNSIKIKQETVVNKTNKILDCLLFDEYKLELLDLLKDKIPARSNMLSENKINMLKSANTMDSKLNNTTDKIGPINVKINPIECKTKTRSWNQEWEKEFNTNGWIMCNNLCSNFNILYIYRLDIPSLYSCVLSKTITDVHHEVVLKFDKNILKISNTGTRDVVVSDNILCVYGIKIDSDKIIGWKMIIGNDECLDRIELFLKLDNQCVRIVSDSRRG